MIHHPPRESEPVSWLFVVLWTAIIFLTIPLARTLQAFIHDLWGRDSFTYIVFVAIVAGGSATVGYLFRRRSTSLVNYLWLILVALAFGLYAYRLNQQAPEEALHFIEYGILGVLLYRALSHRIRDYSIYICAALLGAIIGTIDETIQWLTPNRFWAYGDIWLNFSAVSLIQVGIAGGLSPSLVAARPQASSLRIPIRLLVLLLLLLTISLLNTPARISWYTEHIEILEFLNNNPSTMNEYGYLYQDPDIGLFRSRLSPEELQRTDSGIAEQAAAILDEYRDKRSYSDFLLIYPPQVDPFLHEARVHLFRRDRYLSMADKFADDESTRRINLDVAYRENLIMERYFSNTLQHSQFALPPTTKQRMAAAYIPDNVYHSPVSKHLLTLFNELQLVSTLLFAIFALLWFDRYIARREKRLQAAAKQNEIP
jgi:uncharacterized membrane protein